MSSAPESPTTNTTARPLFIFDGQCGFCRCWVDQQRPLAGDRVAFAPFQDVADQFPHIPRQEFAEAAHFIEPDGRVSRGAEAIFRTFALAGRKRPLWAYQHVPGFAAISEFGYRVVAHHRPLFSRLFPCMTDPLHDLRSMHLSRWLFLRGLGLVYLLAFASLRPQLLGLIGSNGILPAQQFLTRVASHMGTERYWQVPTLGWLNASDGSLRLLCSAGLVLSILLILDIVPALVSLLLWILYLSIVQLGDVFLQFQWDALLLETGLLAIFLAPLYIIPRPGRVPPPPSRIAIWLLRWLLFRLMLLSGLVKMGSGDPTWRNLTAVCVHYETQPLSNWIAWHFHQLPTWFHQFSCGTMFAIELVLPLGIFLGRRIRRIVFAGFVFLQLLIIATGNYGFFNILTLVLCILLLDDGAWPKRLQRWHVRHGWRPALYWPAWLLAPIAAIVLLLTTIPALHRLGVDVRWPTPIISLYRATAPTRSFNAYGLFAAMTHERPEIIVEGSDDGVTWKPYELRYKPGDPLRHPPFVAPHMPRLDWQMWFAALAPVQHSPWFFYFCKRLLEGSPTALGLLDHNPFPGKPPRYVRALLYDYRFTDRPTRAADGRWWRREYRRLYCPPLDLDFFRRRGL